jgi:hypothetical protein
MVPVEDLAVWLLDREVAMKPYNNICYEPRIE